jgi:hypothetical protein
MLNIRKVLTGLIFAAVAVAPAAAQSLGDLARKEEARRQSVKQTGKVYTNDTLGSAGVSSAPPVVTAAPPTSSASEAQAAPGTKPAEAGTGEKKDEAYWRDRITAARAGLDRAKMFQEALQTRINSLGNDFVARDDPAQRQVIAADRQKALAEMDRVKQEIAQFTKAITDTEEEARRAGVPAGWLR